MRRAFLFVVALSLASCFIGPQAVELRSTVLPKPAGAGATVTARFEVFDDRRERDVLGWVGLGGSRWMSAASIVSSEPLPSWLELELTRRARANGWVIAPDARAVQVVVSEVYHRFYPTWWWYAGEGTVRLLVRVDDAEGFARYSRLVEVVLLQAVPACWPGPAADVLGETLSAALAAVIDDPKLQQTLQAMSDASPPTL